MGRMQFYPLADQVLDGQVLYFLRWHRNTHFRRRHRN